MARCRSGGLPVYTKYILFTGGLKTRVDLLHLRVYTLDATTSIIRIIITKNKHTRPCQNSLVFPAKCR